MGTKVWNWRCTCLDEPYLGPRDWSPRIMKAVRELKAKEALVPKHMILTKEEAAAAPPIVREPILEGTSFVVKVQDTHEIVYVSAQGQILMSAYMMAVFNGTWGTVEQGLAAKVWNTPS